jgi:hypothetical protein
MNCLFCKKELIGKDQKKFCSQSCSAKYNNKVCKKGKGGYRDCPKCKKKFLKQELPPKCLCNECRENKKNNLLYMRNPTQKELVYEQHHRSAAFAYIRWHSRKIVMKDAPKECAVCGYDAHVEVAHKKSISDFTDDSRLSEINHPDNLMLLCPNHHWEFDHGRSGG